MSLPKLPLRVVDGLYCLDILDDVGRLVDTVSHSVGDWPIPDARKAAERRLAELTALIEAETPKCPITKGYDAGYHLGWWVVDSGGIRRMFRSEAERDALYDALVALWHKEHGQ